MKSNATENYKTILCALLDCGYLDLQILDDTDEDFLMEAIERLQDEHLPISLNAITSEMFWMAKDELSSEVEVRKDEIGSDVENGYAGEYEEKELEEISDLNPDEDVEWFCNCLDTSIYIINDKYDVYVKYFRDKLDELEDKMGFEFGC